MALFLQICLMTVGIWIQLYLMGVLVRKLEDSILLQLGALESSFNSFLYTLKFVLFF